MATSYPRRNHSGGIWKVTDVAKNLLEHGTWPGLGLPSGRGIFAAGFASPTLHNAEYVTISTTGNATDFGVLSQARSHTPGAVSSSTRGVFGGGSVPPTRYTTIDYFTIASTGNAADFGDLTQEVMGVAGASNAIRGLFMGGSTTGRQDEIEYITIASLGNVIDFGDLTSVRSNAG